MIRYMLDTNILAVYEDDLGRIWVVEENNRGTIMRLFASDTTSFERIILNKYKSLKAA